MPDSYLFDASPPLLLCGIPASGKSTYGRWLEREHGILFVDVEEEGELERAELLENWNRLLDCAAGAREFVHTLEKREQHVVLAWGFPIDCFALVVALKAAGMEIWWFDGDREAARESFIQRATVPLDCFDCQMSAIEKHWTQIAELVGARIIAAVQHNVSYLPCAQIYRRMFGS